MLADIWNFVVDPNNRAVLTWIGGGVVVIGGAIWTVVKFILSKRFAPKSDPALTVTAKHGSIAAGRDVKIDSHGGTSPGAKR
jgi:hypothetical protein